MRKMCVFPLAALLCSICSLSGCASVNYQRPVSASMQMKPDKSYLYGRFVIQRDIMNQFRLALRLDNTSNGDVVSIRLVDDQPVYSVEVRPGTYRMRDITYAPWGAMLEFEVKSIPLPAQPEYISKAFTVEPGKIYYIGDYAGTSKRTGAEVFGPVLIVNFRGGNVQIEQNFINTTAEIKGILPHLQNSDFQPAWHVSQ